jgi:hypothetical protein
MTTATGGSMATSGMMTRQNEGDGRHDEAARQRRRAAQQRQGAAWRHAAQQRRQAAARQRQGAAGRQAVQRWRRATRRGGTTKAMRGNLLRLDIFF